MVGQWDFPTIVGNPPIFLRHLGVNYSSLSRPSHSIYLERDEDDLSRTWRRDAEQTPFTSRAL